MKNIIIRKATISDLEIIQSLNKEMCVKESREYDDTINPEYPFSKAGYDYFKLKIESVDSFTLIAESDGIVVGYLAGSLILAEDYRIITHLAEVENMYVKESFRGKGIGTQLAEEFKGWCRSQNVQRIKYVASAGNNKAISFYKTRGCQEVSIVLEEKLD